MLKEYSQILRIKNADRIFLNKSLVVYTTCKGILSICTRKAYLSGSI